MCVRGRFYRRYRVAWLIQRGEWPKGLIDHKDGDPSNDRWANLREASNAQNAWNVGAHRTNKLGVKGVHKRDNGTYRAFISEGGKSKSLGTFGTAEDAHAAYRREAKKSRGQFERAA